MLAIWHFVHHFQFIKSYYFLCKQLKVLGKEALMAQAIFIPYDNNTSWVDKCVDDRGNVHGSFLSVTCNFCLSLPNCHTISTLVLNCLIVWVLENRDITPLLCSLPINHSPHPYKVFDLCSLYLLLRVFVWA